MKNIYNSALLLFASLLVSSCGNDWLDREPASGTPSESTIISYNDALTARTGMYDGLQGNSNYTSYYGARMIYFGDVRGDDMQAEKQGNRTSSSYEMKYTLDDAPTIWNIPYNVIRRANNIILAIDESKVTDASAAEIGKIYAEAQVVRALVHFDLVKVYGNTYTMDNGASLGIPIVLKPEDGSFLPSRNTVAEVYDQVIKDLTEAINSGFLSTEKTQGYINLWTAKALLSRVYLYKGDNTNALSIAEDIINNSPYTLWTNEEYAKAWDKTDVAHTKEIIFEIVNASTEDWTDREGLAYLYHENGYADAIVTTKFMELLDKDDVRQNVILPALYIDALKTKYKDAKIFVNKYPAQANNPQEMRLNNIPLFRLSEIYLTAAEAAFKSADKAKAAIYLNTIVQRANPQATAITEANITLKNIIIERRKELIGEGQRFFDAMRNNETIVRYTDETDKGHHYSLIPESQKFDRTYFRVLLPIPVDEVNANENLRNQQNKGY